MRKVNLLRCDVARDASMQDLFSELSDTRVALSQAYARFNGIPFVPQKFRNFPAILEHRKIQANPL